MSFLGEGGNFAEQRDDFLTLSYSISCLHALTRRELSSFQCRAAEMSSRLRAQAAMAPAGSSRMHEHLQEHS